MPRKSASPGQRRKPTANGGARRRQQSPQQPAASTAVVATLRVLKRVAVRRYISLDSPKVATLHPDQAVDCVEEQLAAGRLRCRIFLGEQDGYGWISAQKADGTPLIERHGAVEDDAPDKTITAPDAGAADGPDKSEGEESEGEESSEGSESESEGSDEGGGGLGTSRTFGAAMRWRQSPGKTITTQVAAVNDAAARGEEEDDPLAQLANAFDALYHGTRMVRRHRRMTTAFNAWKDLRCEKRTAFLRAPSFVIQKRWSFAKTGSGQT
jgi:hypothetical protein